MRLAELNLTTTPTQTAEFERKNIRPEATLEDWIHANPELLLDEPILIIGRQVRLDTGVADLVALDQFGSVVVIEIKIGRSGSGSASEETILSQPQAYSSSLSTYDFEDLTELYQNYQERLEEGQWNIDQTVVSGGTLQSAFKATFGESLKEHDFNTIQRMVIVAEKITGRTKSNVRYLLEQGLNYQCVETQWFVPPGDETTATDRSLLVSSVVVDYDLSRVRPKQRGSLTFPELIAPIAERVFPSIRSVVRAETIADAFPNGFDTRGAELQSRHPDHPDGVVYTIAVKPDHEEVTLTIDNLEDDPNVVDRIRSHEDTFTAEGFTVKGNTRYRLVEKQWSVESAGEVRDRSDEIGEQFATLVGLGHEMLLETHDESA